MLDSNNYIRNILAEKSARPIEMQDHRIQYLLQVLYEWGGLNLTEIKLIGAGEKRTSVKGVSDADLFVSVDSDTEGSIKTIFASLNSFLRYKRIETKIQFNSIRVVQNGLLLDIIPGKISTEYQFYHTLYFARRDTQADTNVDLHVNIVRESKLQNEIKTTKIWRDNNNLVFPSFYLELIVIEALRHRRTGHISDDFFSVLRFLKDEFLNRAVFDPTNAMNIVSSDINSAEKMAIAQTAANSCQHPYWEDILW